MVQFVNSPNLSALTGQSIGQALGGGLQQLATQKMQQVQHQKTLNQLLSSGVDQNTAQFLMTIPQKDWVKALQVAGSRGYNVFGGQQAQPAMGQSVTGVPELDAMKQEAPKNFIEALGRPAPISPEKAATLAQQERHFKEKSAQKEKLESFKETKELRQSISQKAKTARESLKDLNRMEELEKEGKLDTPGYSEFLKRSGFDIPALMNPGSEEFNKIAANFQRNAKDIYGARVTNFEIEQFLKTIPSLSMSPEGRKRVIANLKNIARADLLYQDTLKEVLKEHKGIPPLDLGEQIDEKVGPKLDSLADLFKKDLSRPVPEGQNRLTTALQSGLGSVIGAPGKLLGGIGGALSKLAL